jgi:hypothetical protein
MRALLALGTANFAARVRPAPTPRRIAVLAAWADGDDLDARWVAALGDLPIGAREHWHVEAEVVRAAFSDSWKGWTPDVTDARALDPAEPALILISGNLRARYVPPSPGMPRALWHTPSPIPATSAAWPSTARPQHDVVQLLANVRGRPGLRVQPRRTPRGHAARCRRRPSQDAVLPAPAPARRTRQPRRHDAARACPFAGATAGWEARSRGWVSAAAGSPFSQTSAASGQKEDGR